MTLSIDYPTSAGNIRLERHISAVPDAPAIEVSLAVSVETEMLLPIGLHPTFRVPAGQHRLIVNVPKYDLAVTYPVTPEPGRSILVADTTSTSIASMSAGNGRVDISSLPLVGPAEELVQLRNVLPMDDDPQLNLHYLDEDVHLGLWWDAAAFPDVLLWISNGGRTAYPWNGRHYALGVEPVNGLFDLGRVARCPADHALADRIGMRLRPNEPWVTRYRFSAW
ncbi:hypothetical protein ACV229_16155 [Burkholderia sp. MR1-5-21]